MFELHRSPKQDQQTIREHPLGPFSYGLVWPAAGPKHLGVVPHAMFRK